MRSSIPTSWILRLYGTSSKTKSFPPQLRISSTVTIRLMSTKSSKRSPRPTAFFVANCFANYKNTFTDNKVVRTQFSHIVSEDFLDFFGLTMQEFNEQFINEGFPEIYNNRCDVDDLKRMYQSDIKINGAKGGLGEMKMTNNKKSIPVNFKLHNHLVTLNLIPSTTIMFLKKPEEFLAIRIYTIDGACISKGLHVS